MASSLGLTATRQLIATALATSSGRAAVLRKFAGLPSGSSKFSLRLVRSYAAAAGTKRATAAKTSATAKKPAAKKTATTAAAKKKSTTTAAKAKAGTKTKKKPVKAEAKSKSKSKAKPKKAGRKPRKASPDLLLLRQRQALKRAALFDEPKTLAVLPWPLFVAEQTKGKSSSLSDSRERMASLAETYKSLTPAQKQRLEATCEQNKISNDAAYKAWVNNHTVDEIRLANNARRLLKTKFTYPPKAPLKIIHDERQPKRPTTAYILFAKSKWGSGTVDSSKGMPEVSRALGQEWKSLSEEARKPYLDLANAEMDRYEKDVAQLGRTVHRHES
ncbi:hypothetical protein F5X96DRAFT_670398 [Biscogniauxia mediterranea]|nr:hypothetical protein F5X96DRAFT_670398 [Biscogniauxia mediterranea]